MIFRWQGSTLTSACRALSCGAVLALGLSGGANGQQPQQGQEVLQAPVDAQPVNPPAAPTPDFSHRPGFLNALGRWLGNSTNAIGSQLKTTQDQLGAWSSQATDAAKDVAGAAVTLPANRIVNGRQVCEVAANGGADCQPAADTLCRSKGFRGGRGLDVRSARRCPTRAWISGTVSDSECRTETFVTRAVCQ
jgi:hypothetical protein